MSLIWRVLRPVTLGTSIITVQGTAYKFPPDLYVKIVAG
jgi:hypothetical protein